MNAKLASIAIIISLFTACKPTENIKPDDQSNNVDITVKMNTVFGTEKMDWSKFYITTSNDTIRIEKLKFLLSEFILEKTTGEFVKIPDTYAYLSLRDGRDSFVLKNVPKGSYKSFRFIVGLDSAINHGDPLKYTIDHPLSPALNDMHWGWSGGYIFNVIEGYYKNNGADDAFSYHIALLRNRRIHSFIENMEVNKNHRIVMNVLADKYFSAVINFSIKNDGNFSQSGVVDPIMDKFIQNANGIFEFNSFK